ncbi:MAG: NFACT family protein, partial [Cyclobacteriaceae bacterium]
MHLNYYFLKRLTSQLADVLTGYEAVEIFSQNKDELILSFLRHTEEFHIKAVLGTRFTALTFPQEFARARRNSVDLFRELSGLKVTDIEQYTNERSFSINFENEYKLLFKMHGKRSNIICYQGTKQLNLFNSQMKFDLGLDPKSLHRNIDQTAKAISERGTDIFPTFDQVITRRLRINGYQGDHINDWQAVQTTLSEMSGDITVYQPTETLPPQLTLFPVEDLGAVIHLVTDDTIEACNVYFSTYTKIFFLQDEKNNVVRQLRKKIKKTDNYIRKTEDKLREIEEVSRHSELADIIMANIHNIAKNATEATLYDFYNESDLKIKLKKDLSPQKNAEYLYRKAKNQKLEIEKLYENILAKESLKETLEAHISQVEQQESMKSLRKYVKDFQLLSNRE